MVGVPHRLLLAEGIAEHEELAHASGQRHELGLAGGDQALVEGAQAGVGPTGGEGGHVEGGADGGAPTPDRAAAAPGAAVPIEGRDADEGGDLVAVERAQFGQLGEQGVAGDRADAGDALQPGGAGAQGRGGLHGGGELRVEVGQLVGQPGQMGVEVGARGGQPGLMAALLLRGAHALELPAPGEQGVEVLGGGVGARAQRRLDLGREARQHPGVEAVGLGQDVAAAGEVAHLPRIDQRHRQPRGDQRGIHGALVAAAGLQHEPGGLQGLRPAHERGLADGRVGDPPGGLGRVHRDIQMIAGNIHAEIRRLRHSGTLRCGAGLPPNLARCGLALAAPATVRALGQRLGAGTTTLHHGLLRPRGNRSVPARCFPTDNPRDSQHTRGSPCGCPDRFGRAPTRGAPTRIE